MTGTDSGEGLISPQELRRIAEEKEMAQIREALEQQKKLEAQQKEVHDAFMNQHIRPDAKERFTRSGSRPPFARPPNADRTKFNSCVFPATSARMADGRSIISNRIGTAL